MGGGAVYCWGCGHVIVVGPGGECVECATAQRPCEPASDVRCLSVRGQGALARAGVVLGAVLALAGGTALVVSISGIAVEGLGLGGMR